MTLDPVVAIPAVLSIFLIFKVSVEAAFYRVYLPALLLLPDSYIWGWPPLNFHQYAIVPIGFVLFWWCLSGKWRASLTDVVVLAFVIWVVASQIHASGIADIGNHVITPLTLAVLPYMAGKLLIEQTGLRILVARRFAFFVFIDAILSAFEFRFGVNPFRAAFGPFFSSVDPWFTQVRYGYGRIAGPFGHAIFMGAIIAIALLLHRYIVHFNLWEERFKWFPNLQVNKRQVILWVLIAGSVMTLSRGPWIALVVGVMIASIGTARNRSLSFKSVVLVLVVGSILSYSVGEAYVAGAKLGTPEEELASAEYRTTLWANYWPIATERSLWGWGSADWPKLQGMASIDNFYLVVALMYGVTGLVLFVLMLAFPILQLVRVGMRDADMSDDLRALVFTMGAVILGIGVAVATVFLGGQLFPLLFLFLGWSDACLVYRPRRLRSAPAFAFRSVVA